MSIVVSVGQRLLVLLACAPMIGVVVTFGSDVVVVHVLYDSRKYTGLLHMVKLLFPHNGGLIVVAKFTPNLSILGYGVGNYGEDDDNEYA